MIHQGVTTKFPTAEDDEVYHYTSSIKLPRIVASGELQLSSGELQLSSNSITRWPNPPFLWATANRRGDRSCGSAAPIARAYYRNGDIAMVRFRMSAEDFIPWAEVPKLFPEWTAAKVQNCERAARHIGEKHCADWCVRTEPLPLARVRGIEAKLYTWDNWRAVDPDAVFHHEGIYGVRLGEIAFTSTTITPGAYAAIKLPWSEWQETVAKHASLIVRDEA
jgi:hypothetical protein